MFHSSYCQKCSFWIRDSENPESSRRECDCRESSKKYQYLELESAVASSPSMIIGMKDCLAKKLNICYFIVGYVSELESVQSLEAYSYLESTFNDN